MHRAEVTIGRRLPFSLESEVLAFRVSSFCPAIFAHLTWAFRLQIHLLKEPCEKARTINTERKKNPPSYKSATWSCCCCCGGGGGRPDFLARGLRPGGGRRGARQRVSGSQGAPRGGRGTPGHGRQDGVTARAVAIKVWEPSGFRSRAAGQRLRLGSRAGDSASS